ncbi:MAG: hypothetical protein IJR85_09340 [Synergistaceae bacterium]|nr:hypothetical protein [Synergistaceae bacterium]
MKAKFLCAVLALFVCSCSEAAITDGPVRLGVMKFLTRTEGVTETQAAAVGDVFARMLTNSKTITVIERDQLENVAGEIARGQSGMITDETAVQIGKIAGCNYMLIGAVTRYEHSTSATDLFIFGWRKYHALATIDVRVVDVETTKVVLSLSESGTTMQKGTTMNFYGMNDKKNMDFAGLEAGAVADAASRLGFKLREIMTGEYQQVLEPGNKDIVISLGMSGGAQLGSLYRVYVDGREIHDADGNSLGHEMNDIAVVKISKLQPGFSTAVIAAKGAGNLGLVRKGDKIFPIAQDELQEMIKAKVFPKSRPKEVKIDSDLEDFLKRK